jgi:hypothetical protein
MMAKDLILEIARTIGEPINPSLPVPAAIASVASVDVAAPGEKVFVFDDLDTDVDEILDVDANGDITVVKRDPMDDTQLTFKGLNSQLEYVLVDKVLSSPDVDVLGRKKRRLAHGMDKLELRLLLKAITDSVAITEVTKDSGEDLYDVIMEAKHAIEDYGSNFVLLAGSQVKEQIDLYDKLQASTFNYNVTLTQKLRELGIDVVKVFGKVKTTGDGSAEVLLDATKFILVAVDSTISNRKPLAFVRRRVSPEIAELMGADVDNAQRALIVNPTPVQVAGTNTLAYGVYAYEQVIWAILNPKAIVKSGDVVS